MRNHPIKNFDLKNKRNEADIIRDVLKFILFHNGCKITILMYKANLSHSQMKGYLQKLCDDGFIDVHHENGKNQMVFDAKHKTLFITEKGLNQLINYLVADKIRGLRS